ncbi:Serum amyloid A-1 protein [Manis javanica]|nr:Serum amyloid A-1 protein [Manis javanica]
MVSSVTSFLRWGGIRAVSTCSPQPQPLPPLPVPKGLSPSRPFTEAPCPREHPPVPAYGRRGTRDMMRAYSDVREANYKDSDKYFHAAQRALGAPGLPE